MIDIKDVYERYLLRKREESRQQADENRPKDKPYYRVSSAGMCARKIYYETIMRLEPTEEINAKTRRVFRLGDLVHLDIQKALEEDI
tara:strand:- start:1697 stop:1957 length:261 start_codon:yes stop_codon:yes gene_type:complete